MEVMNHSLFWVNMTIASAKANGVSSAIRRRLCRKLWLSVSMKVYESFQSSFILFLRHDEHHFYCSRSPVLSLSN